MTTFIEPAEIRYDALVKTKALLDQQVAAVLAFSHTGTNGHLIVGSQTAAAIETLARAVKELSS